MGECTLCPRMCRVDREKGEKGFCNSGALPKAAKASVHMWEEPSISGTNGSGTVFFSGCTLRCAFCQNYKISTMAYGKEITVSRLCRIFFELMEKGVHNLNLVSATQFAEPVIKALETVKPDIPVVWNSGGYERVETLKRLEGLVQIYLPDIKYSDNAAAKKYSNAPDYFNTAKAAVEEMFRQTGSYVLSHNGIMKSGVIIRHLILPENLENTYGVIDYISQRFRPGDVKFSLMSQYTPLGDIAHFPELARRITKDEYEKAVGYMYLCGINDGYVQLLSSAKEEYVPDFDLSGV